MVDFMMSIDKLWAMSSMCTHNVNEDIKINVIFVSYLLLISLTEGNVLRQKNNSNAQENKE